MAEIWKPHPVMVYKQWILALMNPDKPLTNWELQFVLSVDIHISTGNTITQAQAEKLEQIYADKTA